GALSGPGGLTEAGFPGSTTLGGAQPNTFTGPVAVQTGGLTLAKTAGVNALAAGTTVTLSGGSFPTLTLNADNQMNGGVAVVTFGTNSTFKLNGHSDTVAALTGNGALDTSTTSPPTPIPTLTVAGSGNQLFSGAVSGNGTLKYTGAFPNTLTLSGASASFTGTLVQAGGGGLLVSADFSGATVQATAGLLGGSGVVKSITATTGAIVTPAGAGTAGLLSTAAGANAITLNGAGFGVDLASPIPLDQLALGNN